MQHTEARQSIVLLQLKNIDIKENKMKQMTDVYFNVKDFGAVGDGVQDDTQALQKCFDTAQQHGGTAFLPCGRYLVTETLLFGKSDKK